MGGPPLAKKPRKPFRNKGKLGDTKAQRRGRKTPPASDKKPRRGGPLAIGAIIVSVAATWLFSVLRIGQLRAGKARTNRLTLDSALAKPIKYTEHALCRMDCRHATHRLPHIPEKQVLEALRTGSINHRKSDPKLLPCPKLVVDAQVGKNVQAVISACAFRTDVVTVIDKDTNWECYCP